MLVFPRLRARSSGVSPFLFYVFAEEKEHPSADTTATTQPDEEQRTDSETSSEFELMAYFSKEKRANPPRGSRAPKLRSPPGVRADSGSENPDSGSENADSGSENAEFGSTPGGVDPESAFFC